jgi:DNA-binding NtrC family response regulator
MSERDPNFGFTGTLRARRANARVLVVEDNDMVREMISDVLAEVVEVSCTSCVEEALEELAHRHFDAVLMDFFLPDGNGQRIADYAEQENLNVVWMTGDPGAVEALANEKHRFLSKPFTVQALLDTVAQAVALPEGTI